MFFCQVAFVFGLQVQAVLDRVFEGVAGVFQNLDCFAVGHTLKRPLDHKLQARLHLFIDEFPEQAEIFSAIFQGVFGHGLDEFLAQVHIALEIAKGHLRFDHPEFSRVPGGVGILGAESRAEGINVR